MPSRPYVVSFLCQRKERKRILEWLRDEWKLYADPKFDEHRESDPHYHDHAMAEQGVGPESWWRNQVTQYIHRAHTLGLDTPAGRQALIKGMAAYEGMLGCMIRVYGTPPKPGYPSGEIHE